MTPPRDRPAHEALVRRLESAFFDALPPVEAPAHAAFVAGLIDAQGEQRVFSRGCDARQSIFPLGSITKLFVAAATSAWMDGRPDVSLDTPMARLWPAGTSPAPEDTRVTLGHLLSHRAGYDYSDLGMAQGTRRAEHVPVPSARPRTLAREPGRCISYSNHGVARLGRLLERVDAEPIGVLLRRRVWSPLGLHSIRMAQGDDSRASVPVARSRSGQPAALLSMHPGYLAAGGAMASAPDALRFGRWLLHVAEGRGDPVLSDAGARRLLTPISEAGSGGELVQAMLVTGFRHAGVDVFGHTGSWPGHCALLLVFPRLGVALFAAAIVADDLNVSIDRLWGTLTQAVLGGAVTPHDTQTPEAPRPGVYLSSKLPRTHVERAAVLLAGRGWSRVQHGADGLRIGGKGPFVTTSRDCLTLRDPQRVGLNDLVVVACTHDGADAFMRSAQREIHVRSRLAGLPLAILGRWPCLMWVLGTAPLAWWWPGGPGPAQLVAATAMATACVVVWCIGRDLQTAIRVLTGDLWPLLGLQASGWLAAAATGAMWLLLLTAHETRSDGAGMLLRAHQALYTGAASLAMFALGWLGLPVPLPAITARWQRGTA